MTTEEKLKALVRSIVEVVLEVEKDKEGRVMNYKMKFPKDLDYLNDVNFLEVLPNVIPEYEYFDDEFVPVVKIPFYAKVVETEYKE